MKISNTLISDYYYDNKQTNKQLYVNSVALPEEILTNERTIYIDGQKSIIKFGDELNNNDIENIIKNIQQTKKTFFRYFNLPQKTKIYTPLVIKIYSSAAQLATLEKIRKKNVYGIYYSNPQNTIAITKINNKINPYLISHEYVHFLNKIFISKNTYPPQWWSEGLASFISGDFAIRKFIQPETLEKTINGYDYNSLYIMAPRVHAFFNSTSELKKIWLKIAEMLGDNSKIHEYEILIKNFIRDYEKIYQDWCKGFNSLDEQILRVKTVPTEHSYVDKIPSRYISRKYKDVTKLKKRDATSKLVHYTPSHVTSRVGELIDNIYKNGNNVLGKLPNKVIKYMRDNTIKVDGMLIDEFLKKNDNSNALFLKLKNKINNSNNSGMQSSSWQDVVSYMDKYNIKVDGLRCSDYIWQLPEVGRRPYQRINRNHMQHIANVLLESSGLEKDKLEKIKAALDAEVNKPFKFNIIDRLKGNGSN